MHRSSPYKIIDGAVGLADACVSDAREAAGDTWQGSPDEAVGVSLMLDIDLHVYLGLTLHLLIKLHH